MTDKNISEWNSGQESTMLHMNNENKWGLSSVSIIANLPSFFSIFRKEVAMHAYEQKFIHYSQLNFETV